MFLDSNVLINHFISRDRAGLDATALMKRIARGEQKASISPLVVDEVLYSLMGLRGPDFAKRALKTIMMNQNIAILPVDSRALFVLPEYLDAGLEPRDALHAATMQVHGISTICSFDRHFDGKKGIKRQVPR